MTHWNKDQWGAQQRQGYPPFYANAGEPNPGYSQPYAQSIGQPKDNPQTEKSPFEDGRFQPKKRINDVFFLIFFILQVSTCFIMHLSKFVVLVVRRVCGAFGDCPLELYLE